MSNEAMTGLVISPLRIRQRWLPPPSSFTLQSAGPVDLPNPEGWPIMRKEFLALSLMAASAATVPAQALQQKSEAWADKLFGAPANLVHDFGTVPGGAQLYHDFVITNIYAVPIEITGVHRG
jgi:hypothetical protein